MTAHYRPPDGENVEQLLTDLLGKDVAVSEVPADAAPNPATVGVFSLESGHVGAVVVTDYQLANYLGAALSMIPAGVAKDNARAHTVPDHIMENFQEVLNICSAWFREAIRPRITLTSVHLTPNADIPPVVQQSLGLDGLKSEYCVDISGYGSGRVIVFCPDYGDDATVAAAPG